jgi:hypothetical protein
MKTGYLILLCQIALIKQVNRLSFWKHSGDVRSSATTNAPPSVMLKGAGVRNPGRAASRQDDMKKDRTGT